MKFIFLGARRSPKTAATSASEAFPTWRRTKLRPLFPIRAQLVVLLPFRRVAQNLVGLVYFLKLFFGLFLVLGNIGVIFPGKLAKSLLDIFFFNDTAATE